MSKQPTGNPPGRPRTRASTPQVERDRENARRYYYGVPRVATPRIQADPAATAAKDAKRKQSGRQQRIDWLAAYKLAKQCADCDRVFTQSYHLDLDHMPGTVKRFELSKCGGRGWSQILDEVEKCEVVCALCHRDRSVSRKRNGYGKQTGRRSAPRAQHPGLWDEGGTW